MTSVILPDSVERAPDRPLPPHPPSVAPVVPSDGALTPLALDAVRIKGGLWSHLQDVNASATMPHALTWMEQVGWLDNFDAVAEGRTDAPRPGLSFSDSEAYKLLEALAWESHRTGDAWAERTVVELTARIARAQDADGYLDTCFGHDGQDARWSDLPMGHELYSMGHLLQAAVARYRTAGEDELVAVARRVADHVCDEFGPGAREGICGHPEIETALAELGRALDEPRYLDQARLFLQRRGHGSLGDQPHGRAYFQDDVPIADAVALRGHAVRALYLTAAAVDLAVDDGDADLLRRLGAQWDHTVSRRTYLTGGMGSRHQDEGFGEDFELPNDRAYCESCAGIASVMVAWRLLLATGDVRHADLIERTLYNVVATSPRTDGKAFFYANTLHQRTEGEPVATDRPSPRAESSTRAPWFDVSCCPTNLARTFASLSCYVATVTSDAVQVHQYVDASIAVTLHDAGPVSLEMRTSYPDEGVVEIEVASTPDRPWTLQLRVPSWAHGAVLEAPRQPARPVSPGTCVVEADWQHGDVVRLVLPLEPRVTHPDPRIDATRGCAAVERGPEVMCLEGRELPEGWDLDDVVLTGLVASDSGDEVVADLTRRPQPTDGWPYTSADDGGAVASEHAEVRLGRYRSWGEAGPTTMRVWIPISSTSRD
ncbi:MAG: glycoside hydrolase family 127 protein [Nocardioidaceae bacterium]|nr:glycoside hydrolase family 127 protein [Nocardioidaceae bacterium]